jgi:hypothetical protein
MNDRENIACQYVLERMDIFKDTFLIQDFQNFLIVEIFPVTLDEYPLLCSHLIAKYGGPFGMMFIHLMGEELKKRLPEHVSEIEQERVKYLTLAYNQFNK